MSNQVIAHAEIPALDLDRAKTFYKAVFGWDFKEFGKGYQLHNTHKGTTIGLRQADSIQSGNTTIFHVLVDEVTASIETAIQAGGKLVREKTVIPVYGWYAIIEDTEGNSMGLYQAHAASV